ncbi:MAG: sigma-70 family RNA polymerase sigma factor [Sediminibacterium sp.]|nr:sigma-70 family RNA polymerase sigma factor [Sediminibacterium sp.]
MGNTLTDEELVERILTGQNEAITILIQRYQDFAFNLTYKIVRNTQDAEESVQDSFVKAIRAIRAFKQQSSFKTWLYRIVYNTALNHAQRGQKHQSIELDQLDDKQLSTGNAPAVSRYDRLFQAKLIRNAFDKLSPENRIIMSLYYLEQASIEEISEITMMDINLIKVRLHRSREQLKKILKNQGYEKP